MNYLNIPRNKKELILVKPIKRSNYLKNLEKQRFETLKLIEKEKANLLIEKILKTGSVCRDYSIFSNHKCDNKINEVNNIIKDNNTITINSYYYRNKNPKKKKINNSTDFHKNNRVLNKMSPETFIKRNLNRDNFLSIIGDDIINSNYKTINKRKRK